MTARAARAGRQGSLGGHGAHGKGGALVRGGLVVWLNDGPAAPSKTIIAFTILLLHPIHSELKCIIGFGNCFLYLNIEIMFIQTWFLPEKRLVIS